jgi:hypothetical protein
MIKLHRKGITGDSIVSIVLWIIVFIIGLGAVYFLLTKFV